MRDILLPPTINEESIPEIIELIDCFNELFETCSRLSIYDLEYRQCQRRIREKKERLDELTPKNIDPNIFEGYWGHSSAEEVARRALYPEPPLVTDLTLEDTEAIIRTFCDPELIGDYIDYQEYYLDLLKKSLSLPNVSDYIFYPSHCGLEPDAGYQEMARKMYEDRHSAIILEPPADDYPKPVGLPTVNQEQESGLNASIISFLNAEISPQNFFSYIYSSEEAECELSQFKDLLAYKEQYYDDLYQFLIDGTPDDTDFLQHLIHMLVRFLKANNVSTDFFYR